MSILSRRSALTSLFGGLAGCTLPTSPTSTDIEVKSDDLRLSTPLSVLDFGADRTGATSSHGAFTKALEYLRDNRGGALYVPRGRYKFTTGIPLMNLDNLAGGIKIYGDGAATEILPSNMAGQILFWIGNSASRVTFEDLTFLGNQVASTTDIGCLIYASYCHGGLEVNRCTFAGLKCNLSGLVYPNVSDLVMRGCHFGGNSALYANVYGYEWRNVLIEDCRFIDFYQIYGENHQKTHAGNNYWIWMDRPNSNIQTQTAAEHGTLILRNLRLDEGASPQIRIDPVGGNRIERVLIEDVNINVSPMTNGWGGILVKNTDRVEIKRTRCSYAIGYTDRVAVRIENCDVVELENVRAVGGAQVIMADAATQYLHLKDCIYGSLQSQAQVTQLTNKGCSRFL